MTELTNSCRSVLLGRVQNALHKDWDQDFNDILGLAEHGLLCLANLTNYTLQVTPEPGLDLIEWRSNAVHEILGRPAFDAVMRLAAQHYECILVDFGEIERSKVESLVCFKDAHWLYHENQVALGCLQKSSRLGGYTEIFSGAIIGKGLPGRNIKGLEHKLNKWHCGSLYMSSEVPDYIAERGLERLFRRTLADRRQKPVSNIVLEATRLAKRIEIFAKADVRSTKYITSDTINREG